MLGLLCLACEDMAVLLRSAEVAAAMSVEGLLGTDQAFLPELAALRPHPGQAASAANLLRILAGSEIVASHQLEDTRVQDAYSLRCAPQVLGAGRDTLEHASLIVEQELASAIDNPVVLPDGRVRVLRKLPRRTAWLRGRLPRHRRGGSGLNRGAAHRPPPRPRSLARPAAFPGSRSGGGLGPDARPVQRGRPGR